MKHGEKCLKWLGKNGLASVACAVFATSLAIGTTPAAEVDLNKLVEETQQMADGADDMELIWWIPTEFWQESLGQDPTVTPEQTKEITDVLKPYTVVMAVDGTIGSFGGVTYESEKSIRKAIRLVNSKGQRFGPLKESEIDSDAKNFLAMMKPVLGNMLGEMGENMHFLVFPGKDNNGTVIAPASRSGSFSVELGENRYAWRLPLGSLLEPKSCPNDGEKLSGAWAFCPWHGSQLKVVSGD